MKENVNEYIVEGNLDIDKLLDDFYNYVYMIVKNGISMYMSNEDIEEIIADVFVAIWKNKDDFHNIIDLKKYISGITKNIIKNKYRKHQLNLSISDYEDSIIDIQNIEQIIEDNDKDLIIQKCLNSLKEEEYKMFMMYYYENKTINEISIYQKCSIGKVKMTLHRVRKKLKNSLEGGGYSYGK